MTSRSLAVLCLLMPLSSMAADPDEFAVPTAQPVHEVDLLSIPVDDLAPNVEPGPLAVPADASEGVDEAPDAEPVMLFVDPPERDPVVSTEPSAARTVSYPAPVDAKSVHLSAPQAPAPLAAPSAPVEPGAVPVHAAMTEPVGPVKKTTRWMGRAADNAWQATRKGWTGARDKLSREKRQPPVEEVVVDVEVVVEPPPLHTTPSEWPLAIPGDAPPMPRAHVQPSPQPAPAPAETVVQSEQFVPERVMESQERKRRKAGLYVGVTQATTTLAGERSRDFGVEGGLHLYRRLLLGGALHGVQNVDGTTAFAYGGFQPGITWKADRWLHLRTDMLWGLGFVQEGGSALPVNVFMPRVAAEVSVGRVIKLDVHAAYRKVPNIQPKAGELTGWQFGVGARLGTF
ncbi:MAG: hypothetical protein ACI9MC_001951 [Kiritimatiellia bacterium]|jgi:hypothetical protein